MKLTLSAYCQTRGSILQQGFRRLMFKKINSIAFLLLFSQPSFAYIAGSVSAPPGRMDFSFRTEIMRGLAGPLNLSESKQTQKPSVNIYEASTSYNFGEFDFLQDVTLRLTNQHFTSVEEIYQNRTVYEKDEGDILTLEAGANFVHEVDRTFGFFIRSSLPISMNIQKFSNPKIDLFGIGLQGGVKYTQTLGNEFLIYYGNGFRKNSDSQNSSLTVMTPIVLNTSAWIFSQGAALKIGPFFDGDLRDRSDSAYGTESVRSFRLGFAILPSVRVTPSFGVEGGYIQKLSGTYFRATKDAFLGVRFVL